MTLKSNTMRLFAPITKEPAEVFGTIDETFHREELQADNIVDIDELISAILGRLEQQHAGVDIILDLDSTRHGFPIDKDVFLSAVDLISAGLGPDISSGVSRLKISSQLDPTNLIIKFQAIHGEIKPPNRMAIDNLLATVGGKFDLDKTLAGIDLFSFHFRDPDVREPDVSNSNPRIGQEQELKGQGSTLVSGGQTPGLQDHGPEVSSGKAGQNPEFSSGSSSELNSGTILLIEDDRALRGLTELVLTRAGYRVLSADSSQHAIELYRLHHRGIDLVITDLNLAGDSGLELARYLWQQNPELSIIMTSGDPHGAKKIRSLPQPPVAYLEKPFRMRELVPFIRSVTI